MPPPRTDAPSQPDPNIVEGPRKRRPPVQFAENGDPPVARKKARKSTNAKSVSVEEEATGTPQPPRRPLLIPADRSPYDSSDTRSCSSTPSSTISEHSEKDNEEPEEEDDITELSMSLFTFS